MFVDDVVIAGLLVVGGTLVFMLAVGIFIYQDAQKKKHPPGKPE
ncbi:MAG: cytochrome c oxidase subunit CcoM [Pseudomonadota bacterium]|nr:cytochrome c oxidase subunit CcoM [Pseudomonadota bacterium]